MYFLSKYRRGIKNTYRENIPVSEKLLKDIGFQLLEVLHFALNGFQRKTLLVYPDFPSSKTVIRKICRVLNINLTNRIGRNFNWVLYYEDETFRSQFLPLEALGEYRIVNLHSRDISKVYVEQIHLKVFGYNTLIDPLTYTGKGVKKSNINAKHDGQVIEFPVADTEDGFVYQKLINNQVNEEEVLDMRVPIINSEIPLLYLKHRKVTERFKNTTTRTELAELGKHLSDAEQAQVIEFADKMKLEFGELDILRDLDDKRIYIVDVNNTPFGPPANISRKQGAAAINILARAFKKAFLN